MVLNLKVYDDRHSHLVIFSTHVYDVIENNLLRTQSEKKIKKIINKKIIQKKILIYIQVVSKE